VLEKSREVETFSGEVRENERKKRWDGRMMARVGGYVKGRKAVKDEGKDMQGEN
jgi:hypothetical protein